MAITILKQLNTGNTNSGNSPQLQQAKPLVNTSTTDNSIMGSFIPALQKTSQGVIGTLKGGLQSLGNTIKSSGDITSYPRERLNAVSGATADLIKGKGFDYSNQLQKEQAQTKSTQNKLGLTEENLTPKTNPEKLGFAGGELAQLAVPTGEAGAAAEGLTATKFGGKLLPKLARAGAEGLAYTAGQNLTENKVQSLSDYAENAGINMLFPAVGSLVKYTGENLPGRIINSLIKPLGKDFAYGKNPGKTVADLGIKANTFDELLTNINTKRKEIGASIGNYIDKIKPVTLDLSKTVSPIDSAIKEANKAPETNKALIERLQGVKSDLTNFIQSRKTGNGIKDAQELKGLIGDITKWTGNASDDKLVNKALKQTYGSTRELMDSEMSKQLSPEEFAQYKKASEDYGNLLSAENATTHRDAIQKRSDLISFGARNSALIAGITAGLAKGGSIGAILGALGGVVIDKASATPAFKTRLASLLTKLPPDEITTFFEKVTGAKAIFKQEEINNIKKEAQLLLEAPKSDVRSSISGGKTIPLPERSQSTVDAISQKVAIADKNKAEFINSLTKKQKQLLLEAPTSNVKQVQSTPMYLNKSENDLTMGKGKYGGIKGKLKK